MTSSAVIALVAVMCGSFVGAVPPSIVVTGSNPLGISEYWAPHDVNGNCGATTGQVYAGSYMPQYEGTAVVEVAVAGVTGTYAFYSGGYNSAVSAYMSTTSSYSLAGVTALQGTMMTVRRAYHGMAVLQQFGKSPQIIICGGKSDGGTILSSCETTTFTGSNTPFKALKDLPLGNLYGHTMVSLIGQQTVYLFGGTNGGGQVNPIVYEYDVTGDSWLPKTPQGGVWSGLTNAATFTINGDTDAITCGGILNNVVQNTCYLYDSQSNTFSTAGKLLIRREKFAIVPFSQNGNTIQYFAVGGSDGVEATSVVEVSDDGMNWKGHCGSMFNAMQAAATVSLKL